MKEQLEKMSLDELRALNRAVVALIKERARTRNIIAGATFRLNQLVEFNTGRRPPVPAVIQGKIIKISKVTATVLPEGALPWRVSLSCLRPVADNE